MKRLALTCALLALAACASDEEQLATTQVTLRIDADEALRARTTSLRAVLYVQGATGFTPRSELRIDKPTLRFPLDLPILPSRDADRGATLEVLLETYEGTTLRARSRAVTQFEQNLRKTVFTSIASCTRASLLCSPDDCHGADCQVCRGDACVSAGFARSEPDVEPDVDAGIPTSDAGSTSTQDGAASVSDGAVVTSPDASTRTPPSCPADHGCKAPYACVPTTAGYTCRGHMADWPMPDAVTGAKVAPRFAVRDRTVLDQVTQLEWQIGIPRIYPGCTARKELIGAPPGDVGELCTRDEARTYCEQLDHAGGGWRLPTMIELVTLLDTARDDRSLAIDTRLFGETDYYTFLSASFRAGGPGATWGVYYAARETLAWNAFKAKVRCVRGGAEPSFAEPSERYVSGSGTVRDRATTLVWQSTVSPTKLEASAVDAYCASAGFRVPTTNELLSLVDPTREKPALDATVFPNTPSDVFWSASNASRSSQVSFESGSLERASGPAHVRCVRNE